MIIFFVLLLNLGISWWNARIIGMCWSEVQASGVFGKLLSWSTAIQSAVGFRLVYLFVEAGLLSVFTPVGSKAIHGLLSLGYLAIIFPAIGSGLIIMIHSWMAAYRKRDIATIGTAAYNTYAMVDNSATAARVLPGMFEVVGDLFGGADDEKGLVGTVVLTLVCFALASGAVTTYLIIRHYLDTMPLLADAEGDAA